jgi:hypothetical protein
MAKGREKEKKPARAMPTKKERKEKLKKRREKRKTKAD